jgi:purine-nucleoside phosphorylase
VSEAICARHMGLRVAGISCITNLAAGLSAQQLSHREVTETGERVKSDFIRLLNRVIPQMV